MGEKRPEGGCTTDHKANVYFHDTGCKVRNRCDGEKRRGILPPDKILSIGSIVSNYEDISYDCHGTGAGKDVLAKYTTCFESVAGHRTYMAPLMNIKDIPIFSFRESCSPQIIGTGKTRMIRSEIKFIEPYARPALV